MAKASKHSTTVHGVLGEPRGRLLTALCGHPQTAAELAEHVGTSSNAVRVHLDGLRAAGLVDYAIERRGVGKPTHVYSITAAAETLLSSAYAPALRTLLATLHRRVASADLIAIVRETGQTLADRLRADGGMPSRRGVGVAVEMLSAIGASASVSTRDKQRVLGTACCPLAAISRETPDVCVLMEEFLSSASGLRMRERCERGEHPRCSFIIGSVAQA